MMPPQEFMRMGARVLAATFGGPGIFYLWLGFHEIPGTALNAGFYLAAALVLTYVADTPGRAKAPARRPFSWKRRR